MDETYGTSDPLEGFRADPEKNPLLTPTGKLEIYCQAIVEDYEARGYDSKDRNENKLANGGTLKIGPGEPSDAARYVYPIPMYIPLLEGAHKHAETGEVIDPLRNYEKGYKFVLGGWHIMYRSHSTHNNNAYLNEVFKKNINKKKTIIL
jgi:anaerobic dimethyl sulfoxide reductase subunit A